GDLVQVGAVFLPTPHIRLGLELSDGDAPRRQLARALTTGLAEPWTLRRRIGLGADPDVVLAGLGVDLLHQLAGLVREPAGGGGLHGDGHDVFSCKSSNSSAATMPSGCDFIQGRRFQPAYSCPRKFASADLDPGQCPPTGLKRLSENSAPPR